MRDAREARRAAQRRGIRARDGRRARLLLFIVKMPLLLLFEIFARLRALLRYAADCRLISIYVTLILRLSMRDDYAACCRCCFYFQRRRYASRRCAMLLSHAIFAAAAAAIRAPDTCRFSLFFARRH